MKIIVDLALQNVTMLMVLLPAESLGVLLYSGKLVYIDANICGIDLKYDWCSGIRIQSGDSVTVVINVYLPYECQDNEDTYINDLAAVSNIID